MKPLTPTFKKIARSSAVIISTLTIITFWVLFVLWFVLEEEPLDEQCYPGDTVVVIPVHGELDLYTDEENDIISADYIASLIEQADQRKDVEAIVLDIYSPGGVATAGEVIMNALQRSSKPTVALIRETATSAAYLAASGADRVYAMRFSDVGSIGFTMSFLNEAEKQRREGMTFVEITSAPYKDITNSDRPLSEEERQMLVSYMKKFHDILVATIAENRQLPVEDAARIADGSSFTAQEAVELGLIDEVGDLMDVLEDLEANGLSYVEACYLR